MQEDDLDILVVDDDEAFGCLIETMLAWAGFRCRTVASGEAALAAIDTKQPLVIVLDVHLPEISGYDVCRNVRSPEMKMTPTLYPYRSRTFRQTS